MQGDYRKPPGNSPPSTWNRRQVLYEYWARWSCWYKYQPLDHIREYFGEKIGIYFAWLGFYTGWLLPAAAVGFLVFLNEVCSSDKKYRMCPRCDEKYGCDYWYISDNCIFTKITYLFDHPGTVFYAIFVSFWAVTFLEYWKRKSASLAHHWDCMDFEEEEERPRPEFAARASHVERNPITGAKEPAFPARVRKQRVAAGVAILLLMIALVLVFMVSVIVYRVLVSIPLFRSQSFKGLASVIASSSGAFVNLIFIMILGKVYERLAYRLTQWEMHRTQTDFDNNLTLKVFLFQFVNFYSSIFYIAFFKGRFVGYPGKYGHLLGLRNEEASIVITCSGSDCLSELAQQLAVIMVGKQMINNAQEILVPKIKAWWHRHRTKMVYHESLTRWEQDYQLIQNEGLFQEYLEMVLQFGFITIFVAAFPLAPLFALLNNWVEIRLDAQKFVCETRRCVPERAQNIGIWFSILEFLAKAAVISNAFLIAFTSDFLTRTMYRYEFDWDLKGYVNFTLAHAPKDSRMAEAAKRRRLAEVFDELDDVSSDSCWSSTSESSSSSSDDDDEVYAAAFQQLFSLPERRPKVEAYVTKTFKRNFRVTRPVVDFLAAEFAKSPHCPQNSDHGGLPAKSAEEHILSFLWYAANKACIRDVAGRFEVAESTHHRMMGRVTAFLLDIAPNVIKFPSDLQKLAVDFEKVTMLL
ncbi:hypothetical protein MRX96_003967 [Rhipicephalus microplus]